MKLLVATRRTQGDRDNDYSFCTDGELITMQDPCAKDRLDPDGGCGCGRGFVGMSSHRATTTVEVRELPWLTRADLAIALRSHIEESGFGLVEEHLDGAVSEMLSWAEGLPTGTVLRRRLDVLVASS